MSQNKLKLKLAEDQTNTEEINNGDSFDLASILQNAGNVMRDRHREQYDKLRDHIFSQSEIGDYDSNSQDSGVEDNWETYEEKEPEGGMNVNDTNNLLNILSGFDEPKVSIFGDEKFIDSTEEGDVGSDINTENYPQKPETRLVIENDSIAGLQSEVARMSVNLSEIESVRHVTPETLSLKYETELQKVKLERERYSFTGVNNFVVSEDGGQKFNLLYANINLRLNLTALENNYKAVVKRLNDQFNSKQFELKQMYETATSKVFLK